MTLLQGVLSGVSLPYILLKATSESSEHTAELLCCLPFSLLWLNT